MALSFPFVAADSRGLSPSADESRGTAGTAMRVVSAGVVSGAVTSAVVFLGLGRGAVRARASAARTTVIARAFFGADGWSGGGVDPATSLSVRFLFFFAVFSDPAA